MMKMKLSQKGIVFVIAFTMLLAIMFPYKVQATEITHGDISTVGSVSAGLSSVAVLLFSWGFGAPLQASILIHTGLLWAADKVEVGFIPDQNFDSLAAINVPTAPSIATDNLIAPSDISAANGLLQDLASSIGAIRALDTSLNRQWTAANQGEFSFAVLQSNYINSTIIPSLQTAMNSAEANLAEITSGFTDVNITAAQVESFVADVNANGFPQEEIDVFNLLGATSSEIDAALMTLNFADFSVQPVYSMATDGFQNLQSLVQFTTPFAQSVADDAPIPEPSTIILFGIGALGIIGMGYRQRKKAA